MSKTPSIPTIDISTYLTNPSTPTPTLLSTIRTACRETGFFQLSGHGIPPTLQTYLLTASKKFFALPTSTKLALDASKTRGYRGYDVFESQSYQNNRQDRKEGYLVGEDLALTDPFVVSGRPFVGPNVWPDETLLSAGEFRVPLEEYHAAITDLAEKVLVLIADSLPYGRGWVEEFVSNHAIKPLRLLHYPPPEGQGSTQLGAGAHTDMSAITLLLQDETGGLEVQERHTGEWIPVPPMSGAYVVNVGDILSRLTGGEYVSSVHRVRHDGDGDRYSAAFFYDGNLEASLRPLSGVGGDDDAPETAQEHLVRRMMGSYGSAGEYV